MNNILTFEHLELINKKYEQRTVLSESYNYRNTIKVFLSHRHDESTELINKVRVFFLSQGADLYIDWLDDSMPRVTCAETAEIIKTRIKSSQKFVILATPKSIESIWMPWEIGLADQMKELKNISILPIIKEGQKWEKREYYQLYNRIERINNKWLVLKPEHSFTGDELSTWLRQ